MKCTTVLNRLDELLTGELSSEAQQAVRSHLDQCPPCRAALEEMEDLAALARGLRGRAAPSCWPAVKERLFHRLARLEPESRSAQPDSQPYWVAFSARGITAIVPGDLSRDELEEAHYHRFDRELEDGSLPERYQHQIRHALSGEAPARPAVDLSALHGLERRVLEELLRIPKGQVRPYGWLARRAGHPRAARAVGSVCARNPVPFLVPCHRVVPATGGIGNYAFGPRMKRELLEREGVPVGELERLAEAGARYVASRTTGIFCLPTCPDARRIREPNRLLVKSEAEAHAAGLRPCRRCRPVAAA